MKTKAQSNKASLKGRHLSISTLVLTAALLLWSPSSQLQAQSDYPEGIPLIGVLSQPATHSLHKQFAVPSQFQSYIAQSSIDYIDQSGAIPIVIPYDAPLSLFNSILENIQAVVVPSGSTFLHTESGSPTFYQQRVSSVVDFASRKNLAGIHFPVLGIGSGMHSVVSALVGKDLIHCGLDDIHKTHILVKTRDFGNSAFWSQIDKKVVDAVLMNKSLYFSHDCGLRVQDLLKNSKFQNCCTVTTTATTSNGIQFAATAEHKTLPIRAVEFNPEMTQYEKLGVGKRWLPRPIETLKFVSSMIMELAESVRKYSVPVASLKPVVQNFNAMYYQGVKTSWSAHDDVVVIPRYQPDLEQVEQQGAAMSLE